MSPASGEDGWLSLARGGLATGAHVLEVGGRWKSQNRNNVYLSPYVEEPLNSKVIKTFGPELRSRKCFSCFEIPMFYVIYVMNIICMFHISVSGYATLTFLKSLVWLNLGLSPGLPDHWRTLYPLCERNEPLYSPSGGLKSKITELLKGWFCHQISHKGWYYLPTPPLGQDMTQGQFLSGV